MAIRRAAVAAFVLLAAAPAAADCKPKELKPQTRFAAAGGEVIDRETGLIWQRCSVGQVWAEGKGCLGDIVTEIWGNAQKLANDPWRLPTAEELKRLDDPACEKPAVDEAIFPGTGDLYWTSDVFYSDQIAWGYGPIDSPVPGKGYEYTMVVEFTDGFTHPFATRTVINRGAVRLVRGDK